MPDIGSWIESADEKNWSFIQLALAAQSLDEFADQVFPLAAQLIEPMSAFLYLADPRLPAPYTLHQGLDPEAAAIIGRLCAEHLHTAHGPSSSPAIAAPGSTGLQVDVALYPLRTDQERLGLLAFAGDEAHLTSHSPALARLSTLIAHVIGRLLDRGQVEGQIARLNTYLTVSSMLSQEMGLHELLEIALYCCIEAVSAETASVLLLDDEKRNFHFYQVEGPTKLQLEAAVFPADKGLAGGVLASQESEIINDAASDPRFYGRIDSETGFQTRNMVAVPLTAGEERIGVLEVLNKIGGGAFTEEDRLVLLSISQEIAFAIRNARVFEYVADTYCKQRQGQASCRGCKRPLGSWTPCVRYREVSI